ncbi:hypothetical protein H4R34_004995 [Dimargaris verticillata]|uniref:Pentacotripeptide-repeat region of PRORP domain-containing protein n=1 Tax=Dimargaris verticillata TaxID=2761393 RepID=A0A9W8E7K2_9FUNG|nr:hypothetical protein H4R34_004995 [Dimargaris verticillata]
MEAMTSLQRRALVRTAHSVTRPLLRTSASHSGPHTRWRSGFARFQRPVRLVLLTRKQHQDWPIKRTFHSAQPRHRIAGALSALLDQVPFEDVPPADQQNLTKLRQILTNWPRSNGLYKMLLAYGRLEKDGMLASLRHRDYSLILARLISTFLAHEQSDAALTPTDVTTAKASMSPISISFLKNLAEAIAKAWWSKMSAQLRAENLDAPSANPNPDPIHYTHFQALVSALGSLGRPANAWEIIHTVDPNRLNAPKPFPTSHLWALFRYCAANRDLAQGQQLWDYIRARPYELTPTLFSYYLVFLVECQQFKQLLQAIEGARQANIVVPDRTYEHIFNRLAKLLPQDQSTAVIAQELLDSYFVQHPHTANGKVPIVLLKVLVHTHDSTRFDTLFENILNNPEIEFQPADINALLVGVVSNQNWLQIPVLYDMATKAFQSRVPVEVEIAFMAAYAKSGQPDPIVRHYHFIKKDLQPETLQSGELFHLLSALVFGKQYTDVLELYSRLRQLEFDRSARIYEQVLKASVGAQSHTSLRQVYDDCRVHLAALGFDFGIALAEAFAEQEDLEMTKVLNQQLLNQRAQHPPARFYRWIALNMQVRQYTLARRVYKRMRSYHPTLTPPMVSKLLRLFSEGHQMDLVRDLHHHVEASGGNMANNAAIFCHLFDAYLKDRDARAVDALLSSLSQKPELRDSLNAKQYNYLIQNAGRANCLNLMMSLYKQMKTTSHTPTSVTFSLLLRELTKVPGNADDVTLVLADVQAAKLGHDDLELQLALLTAATYTQAMSVYVKVSRRIVWRFRRAKRHSPSTRGHLSVMCHKVARSIWMLGKQRLRIPPSTPNAHLAPRVTTSEHAPGLPSPVPAIPPMITMPRSPSTTEETLWTKEQLEAQIDRQTLTTDSLYYVALLIGMDVLPCSENLVCLATVDQLNTLDELGRSNTPVAMAKALQGMFESMPTAALNPEPFLVLYGVTAFLRAKRPESAQQLARDLEKQYKLTHLSKLLSMYFPSVFLSPLVVGLQALQDPWLAYQLIQWVGLWVSGGSYQTFMNVVLYDLYKHGQYALVTDLVDEIYHDMVPLVSLTDTFLPPVANSSFILFTEACHLTCPQHAHYSAAMLPNPEHSVISSTTLALSYAHGGKPRAFAWVFSKIRGEKHIDAYFWASLVHALRTSGDLSLLLLAHQLASDYIHHPPEWILANRGPHDLQTWKTRVQGGELTYQPTSKRHAAVEPSDSAITNSSTDTRPYYPLPPIGGLPIPVVSALISAYTHRRLAHLALDLWQKFLDTDVAPNCQLLSVILDVSTNTMLMEMPRLIPSVLACRERYHMVWTTNTYTSLIEAHLRFREYTAALAVLTQDMPKHGVQPDTKLIYNMTAMLWSMGALRGKTRTAKLNHIMTTAPQMTTVAPGDLPKANNHWQSVLMAVIAYTHKHFPKLVNSIQLER